MIADYPADLWLQASPYRIKVSNSKIEQVEQKLLNFQQVDCPLVHRFAPGVYYRQITMPAGALIIGHEHKTSHFNVITRGRALVMMNGEMQEIVAPCVFQSEAGVRKVLLIQEEMEWATIHPTNETDLQKLEEILIIKSESYELHMKDVQLIQQKVRVS